MLSEPGTLKEIIRFEWRHHSRQPTFFAAAALFFLLGVLTATSFGAGNVPVSSPYLVMEAFGFLSLFSLFAVAIFASSAVLRDDEHRMREIVYSTPVGRFPFLFGRFAGSFLATLTAVSLSAAGSILATFTPLVPADRVAAFDLRPYLAAFAVITIPNVLFATALLFTVALRTRNAIATYAAAIVVYILYFVCSALTDSPLMAASKAGGGGGRLPALVDPFGLTGFFDVTRYWTAAAKSVRFVPLTGTLLANRAIWLAAAVMLWLVLDRTFRFRQRGAGRRPAVLPAAGRQDAPPGRRWHGRRAAGTTSDRPAGRGAAYLSLLCMELRALFSKTSLLLLVVWLGLAASQIYADVLDGEYRSTLYPHASLIMASLQQPLWLVGMILILYFGAEMFWREQRFRMAPILDSTPVSGAAMIVAKWTALAAVIAALILGGIATGVAIQISRGFFDFQPWLYLSLFYFAGLPLLLYAAASLFVHALSPGKYAGMVFFLLFVIFTRRAPMLGLEHPLWRFAFAPPVIYSEMNGFGDSAAPFHRFMVHGSAVALLFVTMAVALWRRIGAPIGERFRILRHPSGLALALLVVIAGTGAWIFGTTAGETPSELLDWKADYEKAYKHIESLPGPTIREVDANVDLHPGERRFHVAARYALVNETGHPIDRVFVAVRREARVALLTIPGAQLTARDSRFGMSRFDFQRPMMPGSRAELRFDFTVETDDDTIAGNGSLVMSDRNFPSIGYRRTYELLDPRERRKRGLPEVEAAESGDLGLDDSAHPFMDFRSIDFRTTVSTSVHQIAVAPGRLEQTWTGNGRRWFRYRSDAPIVNRFGFASARYAVAKREHRGVTIEVDYDAKHATNVAHILDTAEAAVDVMQASVAPYPHSQLRIAEVPASWPFAGFALPQTILLREDRAFLTDMRDPERPDLIARRVAHEVAHQWFGYRIVAGSGAGGLAITESLAKYGELLVVERMHGREHVRRLLEIELDRYLTGRAREEDREVPLSVVERQPYLYYNKGAVVLWAIRDLIGPAAMDAAIRGLLNDRNPTGTDLARHLRLGAGAANAVLIDQWMNDIVLYDLRADSVRTRRRTDGRFDVTLRIHALKVRADGRGNESPLPMEEPIEIAIEGAKSVLHSQKYVLHTGMNEITVVVDAIPQSATVDPWVTRIDRNPLDNTKAVER